MTNLITIDCTRNATSTPCFIVFDTWNQTPYAKAVQHTSGWAISYPTEDGGWRIGPTTQWGFASSEKAIAAIHSAFEHECATY
jgi:hypothetical protein